MNDQIENTETVDNTTIEQETPTSQQEFSASDNTEATAIEGTSLGNLESLLHIPLEVSVELGRVKLPLHSVVRISRGSIIQLNKDADSLVDILANGSVFARGEVIKANGKLGIRIIDIVTPAERIQSLT